MKRRSWTRTWLACAWATLFAFALGACMTGEHRSIQTEFNEAVQADNEWTTAPYAGADPIELYRALCTRITPAYIEALDPKLRQNAWMLLAVASWRSGELEDARDAARAGLATSAGDDKGSRDRLILSMIPALVIDSELREKFSAACDADGKLRAPGTYPTDFETDFQTAITLLWSAETKDVKPETPPSAIYYLYYQQWRLIQNWRQAFLALPDGDVRDGAMERCAAFLNTGPRKGETSGDIATAVAKQIPPGHPLRQVIEAQNTGG